MRFFYGYFLVLVLTTSFFYFYFFRDFKTISANELEKYKTEIEKSTNIKSLKNKEKTIEKKEDKYSFLPSFARRTISFGVKNEKGKLSIKEIPKYYSNEKVLIVVIYAIYTLISLGVVHFYLNQKTRKIRREGIILTTNITIFSLYLFLALKVSQYFYTINVFLGNVFLAFCVGLFLYSFCYFICQYNEAE